MVPPLLGESYTPEHVRLVDIVLHDGLLGFGSGEFVGHERADDDDGDSTAEHGGARVVEPNHRQGRSPLGKGAATFVTIA